MGLAAPREAGAPPAALQALGKGPLGLSLEWKPPLTLPEGPAIGEAVWKKTQDGKNRSSAVGMRTCGVGAHRHPSPTHPAEHRSRSAWIRGSSRAGSGPFLVLWTEQEETLRPETDPRGPTAQRSPAGATPGTWDQLEGLVVPTMHSDPGQTTLETTTVLTGAASPKEGRQRPPEPASPLGGRSGPGGRGRGQGQGQPRRSSTERVLQQVGEPAVPVGDMASALRQRPQDVREGRQAPVYARSLPQGWPRHSRHTWGVQRPPHTRFA